MSSIRVRWSATTACALAIVLLLEGSGCKEQPMVTKKKTKPVACDQTIRVDPTKGAYPLAVFLCEDDTVTWDPNGHQFQVDFQTGSPFVGGQTTFDNNHLSGTVKHHYDQLEVYKYTITIDKTNVFDPQVVGGGNP
jgi:hypothetical protein